MVDQRTAEQRRWWALALLAVAQFVVILDASVVNVAMPSIGRDLHLSEHGLAWLVNAYVLAFGGFLLLGGRMADLLGRRRMFMAGFTVFALASLAGGLSSGETELIAARALQGLGAAALSPAALSLLTTTFAEGAERNRALGVWGAAAAAGGAAGGLLGGLLTQGLGWEWVFWINTPIGLAAAAAAPRLVRESRAPGAGEFDALGAFLVTGALTSLVYALMTKTWGVLAVSAALGTAFAATERRAAQPLVPFAALRSRNLTGALSAAVLLGAALTGMFFFASLYTQQVLGYGPLKAGAAYLPLALTIGAAASAAGQLATRFGPRPVLIAGLVISAAGLAWFARVHAHGGYLTDILGPSLVAALGMGLSFVPLTITAMSGVGERESGLAGGLLNTSQQIGGALGLALLTTVATARTGLGVTPESLTAGFREAFLVAGGIALLAAAAVALIIRRGRAPVGVSGRRSRAARPSPAGPRA